MYRIAAVMEFLTRRKWDLCQENGDSTPSFVNRDGGVLCGSCSSMDQTFLVDLTWTHEGMKGTRILFTYFMLQFGL